MRMGCAPLRSIRFGLVWRLCRHTKPNRMLLARASGSRPPDVWVTHRFYVSYRRSLTGIILVTIAWMSSIFWFPAPAEPDPRVLELLAVEVAFLESPWTVWKTTIVLLMPGSLIAKEELKSSRPTSTHPLLLFSKPSLNEPASQDPFSAHFP